MIRPSARILDLGSAPGGWVQYELETIGSGGYVLSVDIKEYRLPPFENVGFLMRDIRNLSPNEVTSLLGGNPTGITCDAAPNFSGIREVDMARHFEIAEASLKLATQLLTHQGWFIVKLFNSEEIGEFRRKLGSSFLSVNYHKPKSSRAESDEIYAVCRRPVLPAVNKS